MTDYAVYSSDLWDYLQDMPYMPSRQDRDELIRAGDYKRVQIWDYFFQINPNDIGRPQKSEIASIDRRSLEEASRYNQRQNGIKSRIEENEKVIVQKKQKSLYYGLGGLIVTGLLAYFLFEYGMLERYASLCVSPLALFCILSFVSVRFAGWREKKNINGLKSDAHFLKEEHNELVKKNIDRKNFLRNEIRALKMQIPSRSSDAQVREWLNQDFKILWNKSKDVTALSNRLINIDSNKLGENGKPLKFPNPVAVVGPAELQRPKRIPLVFIRVPDLNKHYSARRSFYMPVEDRIEVLYGVYYLEHILIADDMLATYGLFYNFITGKYHSEEITEQYYKDVVAISTTHEFREIALSVDNKETKYVEDAPTFTLSLASGEHRTVTFVSKKYFMEIKERINLSEDDVSRIYWIADAQENANMAVGALRSRLRLHKETHDEREQ